MASLDRRNAVAAMLGLPALAASLEVPSLPDAKLVKTDPEKYWKRIRDEQFLLPDWRVFLNNGSLGIAPKPVVRAMVDYQEKASALQMDGYPRWGYETLDEEREKLAAQFGCKKDELALMHNATEAISTVAAGLDLAAGDEVIMTDQEHPSGKGGWMVREARHGVLLKTVALPLRAKSPAQLADLMISAIGPRTKVLSFSGIISGSGLIMPVKEICAAARAKSVITFVDGAHMHGQIPVNMTDLGCDFMAGSPHKWLFAPAGCGLLYMREEMQDRLWPAITTDGWKNKSLKAARFMMMGTNNRAIFQGMMAGLAFANAIGAERIYQRIHELSRISYARASKLPYVKMVTPDDDRMFGSLVSFQLNPEHGTRFAEACAKKRIWITGAERQRIAAHIHTRPADIDTYFEILEQTSKA